MAGEKKRGGLITVSAKTYRSTGKRGIDYFGLGVRPIPRTLPEMESLMREMGAMATAYKLIRQKRGAVPKSIDFQVQTGRRTMAWLKVAVETDSPQIAAWTPRPSPLQRIYREFRHAKTGNPEALIDVKKTKNQPPNLDSMLSPRGFLSPPPQRGFRPLDYARELPPMGLRRDMFGFAHEAKLRLAMRRHF